MLENFIWAGNGEMSPWFDFANPALNTFRYRVYLLMPEAVPDLRLRLSWDVLAFDPADAADVTLHLQRAALHRVTLPAFPLDE